MRHLIIATYLFLWGCAPIYARSHSLQTTTTGNTESSTTVLAGGLVQSAESRTDNTQALNRCVELYRNWLSVDSTQRPTWVNYLQQMNVPGICMNFVEFGMPHPTFPGYYGTGYYGTGRRWKEGK